MPECANMARMATTTARQKAWSRAAEESAAAGDTLSAGLFSLLAQPNEYEREGHSCREHALGFSRDGRRGFRCGICRRVIRWVD